MDVRKASPKDLSQLVDLWWEMQSLHSDYDSRFYQVKSEEECRKVARIYYETMLCDNRHTILVAVQSGKVIGMIHLEKKEKPPIYSVQRFAEIQEVIVSGPYRRKGVFNVLWSQAEKDLRDQGFHLIEALVEVVNPAIKAYEKQGFMARQALMIKWF